MASTAAPHLEVTCTWQEGAKFTASSRGHEISLDAKRPFGSDTAMSPKDLVLAGLGGCTAMDIAFALRKHKQEMTHLKVITDAEMTTGEQPITFHSFHLTFEVEGTIVPELLCNAVYESQSKYCGVSAMAIKAAPISYRIRLNGVEIGSGHAKF
jgi:putative redox protein